MSRNVRIKVLTNVQMIEHQGKKLKAYIGLKGINVEKEVIPKLKMSRVTFMNQYKQERIKPEYIKEIQEAGVDFLNESEWNGLPFKPAQIGDNAAITAQLAKLQDDMNQVKDRMLKLIETLIEKDHPKK